MVAEVLEAVECRPSGAHLVMLSDFDGTLTPFTVDPTMADLRQETRGLIETLSARADVSVGLISGPGRRSTRARSSTGPGISRRAARP